VLGHGGMALVHDHLLEAQTLSPGYSLTIT